MESIHLKFESKQHFIYLKRTYMVLHVYGHYSKNFTISYLVT